MGQIEALIRGGAQTDAIGRLVDLLAGPALDHAIHFRALLLLARTYLDNNDPELALAWGTQAHELAAHVGSLSCVAEAAVVQASAYGQIGLHRESMEAATRALSDARACGDARIEAKAFLRLSTLALDSNEEADAWRLLLKSLASAQAANAGDDEFWALNNLSNLLGVRAARQAESADPAPMQATVAELIDMVHRALAVARGNGHWLQQAYAISNLADAYILVDDRPRARALIDEYASLSRQHGSTRLLAFANLDEARLLRSEGRRSQAVALLSSPQHRQVMGSFADLGLTTEQALVRLHKEMGDFESAFHGLERVMQRQQAMQTVRVERQMRVMMARLDVEHAKATAERALAEARIQSMRAVNLEHERDQLQRHSREDALTGVGNRRAADEALALRVATAAQGGEGFFVAFVDIDHFKHINDTLGHAAGDQVLRRMGSLMRGFLRNQDDVFRFGGEEFVLMMSGVGRDAAGEACERLRRLVERSDWSEIGHKLQVTASFGVACWHGETSVGPLLARADAALYAAKRDGRNRVAQA